jgi:hypothetical protein
MFRQVIVLYEDQRQAKTSSFGPHELVKACVFDRVDGDRDKFEAALREYRPLKGNSRVLEHCRRLDRIATRGQHVIAVFDGDQMWRILNLPKSVSSKEIAQTVKGLSDLPDKLTVVLLDKNVESLLSAAMKCSPVIAARYSSENLKSPLMRDRILGIAAREPSLRQQLLAEVPSLATLCDELIKSISS